MSRIPNHTELEVVGNVSRRSFLSRCSACAAAASCAAAGVLPASAAPAGGKVKLRLVFTHIPPDKPTWPNVGFDYEGRKKLLTAKLREACPNVEFLPVTAMNAEEGRKLLDQTGEVDGYVVYMLGLWTGVGRILADAGKRCIFVDDLYGGTGEFLGCYAAARRKGQKVVGVSSSRLEDVAQAVRIFETIHALRSDVILDVLNRDPGANGRAIQDVFGTKVQQVTGDEINGAYQKADVAEGKKMAQLWIKGAQKVVEPKVEGIEKSGRMYVAMRNLMDQYKSKAITMDCLGLFYSGKLNAYPCLGFFHLNNEGKVGACEADLRSTISMLAIGHLVGRPGYISDPVSTRPRIKSSTRTAWRPAKCTVPTARAIRITFAITPRTAKARWCARSCPSAKSLPPSKPIPSRRRLSFTWPRRWPTSTKTRPAAANSPPK